MLLEIPSVLLAWGLFLALLWGLALMLGLPWMGPPQWHNS